MTNSFSENQLYLRPQKGRQWDGLVVGECLKDVDLVLDSEVFGFSLLCFVVSRLREKPAVTSRIQLVAVIKAEYAGKSSPCIAWNLAKNQQHDEVEALIEAAVEGIVKNENIEGLISWIVESKANWPQMYHDLMHS